VADVPKRLLGHAIDCSIHQCAVIRQPILERDGTCAVSGYPSTPVASGTARSRTGAD